MIENLRFDPGEEACSPAFATNLSELGDVYVDDAFGAAHRAHASIVGPPRVMPSAAGRLLAAEVDALGRLMGEPDRPFVAVLGGAKVSDKLGVIDALLERCDTLLIGGAMAFTFLVAQGGSIGDSLVEEDRVEHCKELLATGRIRVPTDVVVAREMSADAEVRHVGAMSIPDGWKGLDIGPETAGAYADELLGARTVLWNGPMGVFELAPFAAGTRSVAEAVADCRGLHGRRWWRQRGSRAPDGSRGPDRSRVDWRRRVARAHRARRSAGPRGVAHTPARRRYLSRTAGDTR